MGISERKVDQEVKEEAPRVESRSRGNMVKDAGSESTLTKVSEDIEKDVRSEVSSLRPPRA